MAVDAGPRAVGDGVGRYALLLVVAAIVLFPIYTMVIASLKPGNKVLERPLCPRPFDLTALRDAWSNGRLGRYLLNSGVVALLVTVCQLVTSVLSAYAFAFLRFPGAACCSVSSSPPCSCRSRSRW